MSNQLDIQLFKIEPLLLKDKSDVCGSGRYSSAVNLPL
jgi:hypothetical protein